MVSIAKLLVIGLNMDIEWFHLLKLTITRVVATHRPDQQSTSTDAGNGQKERQSNRY